MVKDIICVACPMGCQISVELNDDGEILSVTGNTCKRGDAYARTECTHPERSLTTTVKVSGGVHPVVPVKSAKAVPKDKVKDCVKEIAKLEIKAPVKIGDVVCANILGTGEHLPRGVRGIKNKSSIRRTKISADAFLRMFLKLYAVSS